MFRIILLLLTHIVCYNFRTFGQQILLLSRLIDNGDNDTDFICISLRLKIFSYTRIDYISKNICMNNCSNIKGLS